MIADLFVQALLGHLVGDYLLQSKKMAQGKSVPFKIVRWEPIYLCTLHVTLYTMAVAVLMWNANPWVLLSVFVPHWLIDRYSLASAWLKFIHGRTYESARGEWDVAFTALVYTVTDNTLHLLCLYGTRWLVVLTK